jgi:hypothetical protein
MVSSDLGKLDVRRHLISGIVSAIAGAATDTAAAVPAPPAAATFMNLRRLIFAMRFPRDLDRIAAGL